VSPSDPDEFLPRCAWGGHPPLDTLDLEGDLPAPLALALPDPELLEVSP
jgi:hypothetical protein